MQVLNHGSRWPTMGAARARYTRGSTDEGPGVIINRIGGVSSPIPVFASGLICATSLWMCAGLGRTGTNFPASDGAPATDILAATVELGYAGYEFAAVSNP